MIVFKPKFSLIGFLFPVGMIIFLLFMIWIISPTFAQLPTHSLILLIGITGGICSAFLFALLILPTMRYELRNEALYLKCGPFVSKVSYSEIKRVIKTDLVFHPIASCRWPGFALGDCYYGDRGTVRMYSTRMCSDIILIETVTRLYGISPRDEDLFITELKKRIENSTSD
jgi:hypothetical protein